MKAFMSSLDDRADFIHFTREYGQGDAFVAMQERMSEARHEATKILAEAEPVQDNPMLGPGYWSAFEIGDQYPNTSPVREFGEALAVAIAAFVGEEVEVQ